MNKKVMLGTGAAAMAAMLAGCGGGGGGMSGQVKLAIADAPVDEATAVVVQFTGVELQPAGGERIDVDFAAPRQIDLLALQGGDSALLLDGVTVPAGRYNFIRLKVQTSRTTTESHIDLDDGSTHPLFIPSGAESGLKLNRGFTVPAGGLADFTIDFDLRKSVHEPQNPGDAYLLRPTLRIVDNRQVGEIAGTVDAALAGVTGCTPAVYGYAGAGVTPDDVDGTPAEPVATATVLPPDATNSDYRYTLAFLEAGTYTVAFTCDAATDQPGSSETLVFAGAQDATVTADATTTVDF